MNAKQKMKQNNSQNWHTLSLDRLLEKLNTNIQNGLSSDEIALRHKKYGLNILPRKKEIAWYQVFFRQLTSPLVYILIIAAGITIWLKEFVDAGVIMLAALANTSVGFWQEFRSNNILEKLQKIVKVNALVAREGKIIEIDASQLTPGDIILLKPGMKVPADARLIESQDLYVDESILTGESVPVKKDMNKTFSIDTALGDRLNMVYMGTVVDKGEGKAIVVAIGKDTEIGKITLLTQKAQETQTPLQRRIAKLGKIISIIITSITIIIFGLGVITKTAPISEMFKTAIAVVVAAIPEGLPAAISIVLAIAAQRILSKKGVIKRLLAAETLGSTSVICTDKTGTLTKGEMSVEKLVYVSDTKEALNALALANEAIIEKNNKSIKIKGEATDRAKLQKFLAEGQNIDELLRQSPCIKLFPFEPKNGYVASLHQDAFQENKYLLYLSGSPESILSLSTKIIDKEENKPYPLTEEQKESMKHTYENLAAQGYRMIALAKKDIYYQEEKLAVKQKNIEQLAKELTFLGFAAIRDPIRTDVYDSIKSARQAGIRVIMLTGDHRLTAVAIGKELGFSIEEKNILGGKDIEDLSDEQLARYIRGTEIFYRVEPAHKMRIVQSLQKNGLVVAMTGDGVNDAPALKAADIGIALGSGTDVAKEASDLVLLDNSFSVIVSAVKEGRTAFDNIRKVAVFLFSGSFTEILLVSASIIGSALTKTHIPLPVTAVQILWTNLVEDTFPNIALAFEPGHKNIMRRPPFSKKEPILGREENTMISLVAVITNIFILSLFFILYDELGEEYLSDIRTMIFAVLGLDSLFYIFSIKSLHKPIYKYNIFDNRYLVAAVLLGIGIMVAGIHLPFLNYVLKTKPLTLGEWEIIITLGVVEIISIELAKWIFFIRKKAT